LNIIDTTFGDPLIIKNLKRRVPFNMFNTNISRIFENYAKSTFSLKNQTRCKQGSLIPPSETEN
jgi:hypothetical protein